MSLKSIEGMLPRQQFTVKHIEAEGIPHSPPTRVECKHCGRRWFAADTFDIRNLLDMLEDHTKRSCKKEKP